MELRLCHLCPRNPLICSEICNLVRTQFPPSSTLSAKKPSGPNQTEGGTSTDAGSGWRSGCGRQARGHGAAKCSRLTECLLNGARLRFRGRSSSSDGGSQRRWWAGLSVGAAVECHNSHYLGRLCGIVLFPLEKTKQTLIRQPDSQKPLSICAFSILKPSLSV